MDSFINVLLSLVQAPATKAIGYVLKVGANIRALKKATRELKVTEDEINRKIHAATAGTDRVKPTGRATEWLAEAADIQAQASEIETDYSRRATCIGGCMPNCWSGYRISRRAFMKSEEAKEVNGRGRSFDDVTERAVPVVEWQPSMPDVPTLEPYLEEVRRFLRDNPAGVMGIWGMGGVGKTFLLHKIHGDPFVAAAGFDYVIKIVISRSPDVENLQELIAERVGLNLQGRDAVSRANSIHKFLREKNFLLLLDDLWSRIDLSNLGVPPPRKGDRADQKQHIVILTTRFEDVCMKMHTTLNIHVECLGWNASYRLFEESLGEVVTDITRSDSSIRPLAVRIANKCGGLPLALKTVAAAMSSKTTWREWQDAIYMLDRLQLPEMSGEPEDPYPLLKFSYDYLPDDRMRKCFLTCCLWPEDHEIPKDNLILCWMGQGLLDEFHDFRDAYNKGHTIIQDLKKASLLQVISVTGSARICVVVHDVLRDVALWIASDCGANKNKWIVPGGKPEEVGEERWRVAEKISSTMPSIAVMLSQQPHCPNLSTLIILQKDFRYIIPDGFWKDMPALTYLSVNNSSLMRLPSGLGGLLNLRYLDLTHTTIESLPEELGSLIGLEYLILYTTYCHLIPPGIISKLQRLKLLDIRGSLYLNEQGTFEIIMDELEHPREGRHITLAADSTSMLNLQRLSISSRVSLWKLSIRQLCGMIRCLELAPLLLHNRGTRQCLQELSVSGCDIKVLGMSSEDVEGEHSLENLEFLTFYDLDQLEKISWRGMPPRVLFCNLRFLKIKCKRLKNIHWIQQLPQLEELNVKGCDQMERLIGGTEDAAEVPEGDVKLSTFPKLKRLVLDELPNLQVFSDYPFAFPCLETFRLHDCPELKKLPFTSQITSIKFVHTRIEGTRKWWDGLEWEEDDVKKFFENFFMLG